jgi:hypothetical protein
MNTQTQSEEEKTSKPDKSHLQLAKPKWLLAHHFFFPFSILLCLLYMSSSNNTNQKIIGTIEQVLRTVRIRSSLSLSISSMGVNANSISNWVNSGCLSALRSSSLKHLVRKKKKIFITCHMKLKLACCVYTTKNYIWWKVLPKEKSESIIE